jgi:hypothetical protein
MTNPTKLVFNVLSGNLDTITNTDAEGLTLNAPIISGTVPVAPVTGQTWYNNNAVNIKLPNSTLQVGQEMYVAAINKTGAIIPDGSLVYISGADSGYPKIVKAQANSISSHDVLAMTTSAVAIDAVANVTSYGVVHDLNTITDSDGNALSVGDQLYLSATTAGGYTKIEPYAPNYSMGIGVVLAVSATVGKILFKVTHGDAKDLAVITKEPTGFDNPSAVTVTYDPTAKTITLGGTFKVYWRGALVTQIVTGHTSIAHPATLDKAYFYYFDGTAVVWSESIWTFDMVMIAVVQYGTTNKFAIRECHGLMDWNSHQEFHRVVGTYRSSGGTLSDYILTSTTAIDRRPQVSSCTINDEDVPTVNAALTTKSYTQMFLTGTSTTPVVNFTLAAAEIIPVSTVTPYYNQLSGVNWVQTLMLDNQYQALWLIAIPVALGTDSQKYRFAWMQGQSVSTTLSTIQALTPSDLVLGNLASLSSEYVFITKIIIRHDTNGSGTWQIVQVNDLTGNKFIQSSAAAGVYLSAVEHDTTLTGDGSAASPLSVVYAPKVIVPIIAAGAVDLTLYKDVVYVCSNAADIVLDLSSVAGGLNANSCYVFKNINPVGGFKVTLNPNGSETINGSSTSWDLWPQDAVTLIVYNNALLVI